MRLIPALILAFGLAVTTPVAAAPVTIDDVRAMAFAHGIARLEEIELHERRGVWEVEGEDARGHDIEMKVDAATGRIIKMRRD